MRKIYVIDLFCGAGGTSTGVHRARFLGNQFAFVIYCVNHDPVAIASHLANHKETKHYIEDIRVLDLTEIIAMVAKLRAEDPNCLIILWASLECTNFSKAKGGMAREADSRTLAEHLIESPDQFGVMQPRYIPLINPDYVWIENVEEFMSWGPLDENGRPISKKAGQDYLKWVDKIKSLGYDYDYRILNAADFGAYTSRKRYFAQFAGPGLPVIWPQATHAKKSKKTILGKDLFSNMNLQPWKPVKHCLDFSDEGQSIFGRKKELSDRTLERIYAGLIKYIAGGKDAFVKQYNSGTPEHRVKSTEEPCNTITTNNRFALVQPAFLSKYYSGDPDSKNQSVEQPAGTITCIDHHSLVRPCFIQKYNSNNAKTGINSGADVDNPCPTITTQVRMSLVQPEFLAKYHGKGQNVIGMDETASTLTTKDRLSLIQPRYWMDKQYTGSENHQSVDQPAGTIMVNDKHALVKCWVMNTNYSNIGSSQEEPAQTLTASRRHQYLMNPQYASKGVDMESPAFTLIARMDKAPPYIVTTENGQVAIAIYEYDTQAMILIKEFMALYGIIDIKMRMLKVPELLKIQGFPDGYILKGTQADQKKFIGNSVVPEIVTAWMEAFYTGIIQLKAA